MTQAAPPPHLPRVLVEPVVRAALQEDLGRAGDLTTAALIDPDASAEGSIRARTAGRVAGVQAACLAFELLDPGVRITVLAQDGAPVDAGATILRVAGPARALLTGERVALNLLGPLSGIATATADLVAAVAGTGAAIADTRKTTPGLRALEKAAVRAGGGRNHRFGLDDAVLIKDNHVALAGGPAAAVRRARGAIGHLVKIEVEVDTLDQLDAVLPEGPDAVLLDNMSTETLRAAVARIDGRAIAEASGTVTPASAPAIAATGVDVISAGWLTHSAPALDVGLDIEI
ncbi:nicotinate-nucleotide diphosphorylase (carboxylating) [Rhodovibrio sodomensis]|uniref:nicotinate-nucleotide diphosphorylase (carboxylating) n=1 Tax=Rhodovibrio sodomensis TaxID=1088 RepID=A0ABS1DED9_9PROT|nr:carboxylating nicotinate-nucleotide diphosphorylase [Rhodovibrio sodomensis]MBK1667775.1 nicotinate-nucleotide diphosphorylase (carboxylating) [Rhodovibrio sodomensis]